MGIIQKVVGLTMNAAAGASMRKFESDTRRAPEVNAGTLAGILNLNRGTFYGQKFNFASITNEKEFKASLPLTTYSDYKEYIDKMAEGKPNILTSEAIKYFGLTSGTTGSQKMIPVTPTSQRVISGHMGLLTQGLLFSSIPESRRYGRGLLIMNMVTAGFTSGGIPTGAGTSGGMMSMKRIVPYLWTSPPEILQIKNQPAANYLHLLFALKEKNLKYIGAPFASAVLDIFSQLERNWPALVEDIANGSISKELEIDPGIRGRLQQQLRPAPGRAAELQKEFARGCKDIARRVWPGLLYLNCVAGGSFGIYAEKLRFYTGDVPVFSAVYGATEAMIGVGTRPDEEQYVVTPRTAYYEFIPLEGADDAAPQALSLDQLVAGESYEVVITSFAGLYRYRIGDIVKVTGFYHKSPVIEFQYRRGLLLNIAGEKTSEQAVLQAVSQAFPASGGGYIDFTSVVDYGSSPGRYVFFVEPAEDLLSGGPARAAARLEDCLCLANPRYASNLSAGRLGALRVNYVQPGTFEDLKTILISRGASPNQLKLPRVIKDSSLAGFLYKNSIEVLGELIQ